MSELNIPESWAMVSLGKICSKIGSGKTPKGGEESYTSMGIPLIRSQNVLNEKLSLENVAFITESTHYSMKNTIVNSNDVLLNITGGSIGRTCVVPDNFTEGNVNQHVCILRPAINNNALSTYVSKYFRSPYGQALVKDNMKGAAREAINMEQISNFELPLPPLAEIERIITKIESCFEKINIAESSLFKVEMLLEKYRESLFSKAFRGEIVLAQNSHERPANDISNVKMLNANVITENVFIKPVDPPFEIPTHWNWVYLKDLCDNRGISYGVIKLGEQVDKGVLCLRTSDVKTGYIETINIKKISPKISENYKRTLLHGGEVLVNVRGTLGGVAVVPPSLKGCNISREVAMIPIATKFLSDWIQFWIRTPDCKQMLSKVTKGGVYQGINLEDLRMLIVPLPPPNEIHTLSLKLKILDNFIANEKESLQKKISIIKKSKDSILKEAFEGQLVEQISTEGTGHELLAKILADKEANQKTELKRTIKKAPAIKAVTDKGKKDGKKRINQHHQ